MILNGKTAIVTGGATGIGRAIVERFLAEGAQVAIADINGAQTAATALGANAFGIETDVADKASTEAMAQAVADRFGGIDILVNNAGIFTGLNYTPMEAIEVDAWRRIMDVNVMGPWLCARAVLPAMRAGGGGRIINIASVIANLGIPFMLHYVASKGALGAMTRAMARELGATQSGILVNSISPGYTHSQNAVANAEQHAAFEGTAASMRAIARPQHPDDIAGAAVWLAGADGGYINGQNIAVDGGIFMTQ
jgi:p-cumic alcohol dehydrogenase